MNIFTNDKIIKIFCTVDDFYKKYLKELSQLPKLDEPGKKHRNRPCEMSESEIITILLLYHFATKFLRALPNVEKAQWAGFMDLNCILYATTNLPNRNL
jgi:hypothetical protein